MAVPVRVVLFRGDTVLATFKAEKPSQVYDILLILTHDGPNALRVAEYAGEVLSRGGQPPMEFAYDGVTVRAEEATT